eukprot:COSAG06_NODE_2354_length_7021_cov_10.485264_3_plen_117_part_00
MIRTPATTLDLRPMAPSIRVRAAQRCPSDRRSLPCVYAYGQNARSGAARPALLVVRTDGAGPPCSAVHIYRQTQSAGLEAADGGSLPSPVCICICTRATRRLRLLVSFAAAALPTC